MEMCKTPNDLLMRSSTIFDMLGRIEKLVLACNTLDLKLGVMLDKVQLNIFGRQVVELVSEFIDDPIKLQKFANRLVQIIQMAGTLESRANSLLEQAT
jgi:hypothetical protein